MVVIWLKMNSSHTSRAFLLVGRFWKVCTPLAPWNTTCHCAFAIYATIHLPFGGRKVGVCKLFLRGGNGIGGFYVKCIHCSDSPIFWRLFQKERLSMKQMLIMSSTFLHVLECGLTTVIRQRQGKNVFWCYVTVNLSLSQSNCHISHRFPLISV